jgi:hypothetical protein
VDFATLASDKRGAMLSSAAACPTVDEMIPIYFDDPALGSEDINRVSQMFISDTVGKNCNVHEFAQSDPDHPETDQYLRIYASESIMSGTIFPFLDE